MTDVADAAPLAPVGRINIQRWDVATLRREIKGYDALGAGAKLSRIAQLDDALADTTDVENIALDGLLEFIPAALDPTTTASATTSHLALGDGTTDPQATNTSLNNEVYRIQVGDADSDGTDLLASAFLSQTEGNGYTISEVGLVGGPNEGDKLLTHALLDSTQTIDKNTNMVVVFNYVLEFRRPA